MIFITFAITSLIVLLIVLALVLAGVINENDKFKKVIADKGKQIAKANEIIDNLRDDVWDMSDEVQELKNVRTTLTSEHEENINLKQRIHDLEALLRSFAKDLSEAL
jgi:cell division protein FtsB